MIFDKYKQNLRYENGIVFSYNTAVAEKKGKYLVKLGCWSSTTTKHTNYVGKELGLEVITEDNYDKLMENEK
jgi:hypothetical protein